MSRRVTDTDLRDLVERWLRPGFEDRESILDRALDRRDLDGLDLDDEAVRTLVGEVWRHRLAEQESWPGYTDFEELEGGARPYGYTFFHGQDAEQLAYEPAELYLAFGSMDGGPDEDVAVGRQVAAALTAAGLPVDWDGTALSRIRVFPLDWRRRIDAVSGGATS